LRLYPVKTKVIKTGDNIVKVILESLEKQKLQLENHDILAITSKIISYAENRLVKLSNVKPSREAKKLARRFLLKPEFAQLILNEADKIYGGVSKAVLTLKNGVLTANAGIDNKNAFEGYVILWPKDVKKWAKKIKEEIECATGKQIGILIVDSGLMPLRIGTIDLALAVAGFKPVKDFRKEKDIYGKPLIITQLHVADSLASAAHLLMGEAAEKTPVVLIKDAPVDFDDGVYGSSDMTMASKGCIYMNAFECS